jgi:UDP:flavonoid glycosyltransferase YjiC (YdhE family)
MKILIASIPAAGHLNPLLSVASLLEEYGHEVSVQVNEDLRPAVEAAGYRLLSEIPNAQNLTHTSPKPVPGLLARMEEALRKACAI